MEQENPNPRNASRSCCSSNPGVTPAEHSDSPAAGYRHGMCGMKRLPVMMIVCGIVMAAMMLTMFFACWKIF